MSARGPPNLRRWLECGVKEAGKLGYTKNVELAPKTVSGNTTANVQRKGVPDSWRGYSKTMRTKRADGGSVVLTKQCVNSRPTKKLPNRLPKYPVPERLKKCVLENKDVTTIVPSLLKVSTLQPHY